VSDAAGAPCCSTHLGKPEFRGGILPVVAMGGVCGRLAVTIFNYDTIEETRTMSRFLGYLVEASLASDFGTSWQRLGVFPTRTAAQAAVAQFRASDRQGRETRVGTYHVVSRQDDGLPRPPKKAVRLFPAVDDTAVTDSSIAVST